MAYKDLIGNLTKEIGMFQKLGGNRRNILKQVMEIVTDNINLNNMKKKVK